MKNIPLVTLTLFAALSIGAVGVSGAPGTTQVVTGADGRPADAHKAFDKKRVAKGKYLVAAMGCNDCHTPWKMGANGPEPDMTRALSGHPQGVNLTAPVSNAASGWVMQSAHTNTAFAGPWGISYAANLTPDVNTGLGIWTEEIFINAIRTGKHYGVSRPIMPPMPWFAFRNLNDEDLKSIYAYLRSVPPQKNLVPDYEPPKAAPAEQVASNAKPSKSAK